MSLSEKDIAFTKESCFWTVNPKYSGPFREIFFLLTFCRYSMTHGDEVVGGVGEVSVEGGTEGAAVEATERASEEETDVGATEQVTDEAAC